MEKNKDKPKFIKAERKRIWGLLVNKITIWCPDCTEMHDMKQMGKEGADAICFEDKCSGRFIVLPWGDIFAD